MMLFWGKPRQGEGSQRKPPCSGTRGWEQFLPVVKSGRAASMRAPQLRAVRTHDQRDNRCADIKTPNLLTQQQQKTAQKSAGIHLSAVFITEQKHRSESCTYCIASFIQRCIFSALYVWLTGCFKPLTTCWRRDASTAGRATAGTQHTQNDTPVTLE